MKRMNIFRIEITILFIIILIPLFSGCQAKRQISKSDNSKIENKTNADFVSDSTSVNKTNVIDMKIWDNYYRLISEYEKKRNFEISQTEYDTDKPVDKETGKPPVKKETNASFNENEVKKEDQYSELYNLISHQTAAVDSLKNVLKDQSNYDVKITDESKIKESKIFDWMNIKTITVIFIIIALVVFIIIKIKK